MNMRLPDPVIVPPDYYDEDEDEDESTLHFFTFGSEHTLPDGTSANYKTVTVEAPPGVDHRALFMTWLGSNKFSSEYTEAEYTETGLGLSRTITWCITVEAACGQCEWPESQCKCIAGDA